MPYFYIESGKMSQNLSSAAVVIGTLRVRGMPLTLGMLGIFSRFCCCLLTFFKINFLKNKFQNNIRVSNSLDLDQD